MPHQRKGKVFSRKQVKAIKDIADDDVEVKHFDLALVDDEIHRTTTFGVGNAINLAEIPQGDGAQQRLGTTISPTQLILRYNLFNSNVAPTFTFASPVRVLVIQWKENSLDQTGVLNEPSLVNILFGLDETPDTLAESVSNINRHYDFRNRSMFTVLYDQTHSLKPSELQSVNVMKTIKLSRKMIYNATTALSGLNHIYMYFWSVNAPGSDNNYSMTFHTRLRYKDQ